MKPSKKDARTLALLERVEKMCELMLVADRTMCELAEALSVSTSGARNYMRHLRHADLVEVVGQRLYSKFVSYDLLRIKQDRPAIAAMLKDLREQPRTVDLHQRAKRALKQSLLSDKTRRLHMMKDDAPFLPKTAPAQPPGRHWMDLAMFGDGPAPSLAGSA
jgi:predicted ArsR family transcriptional regulator